MSDFILASQNPEQFNITTTIYSLRKVRQRHVPEEWNPGLSAAKVHPH